MNDATAASPAAAPESESAAPWPRTRTAYYTLFILVLCTSSYQLDVAIVPYLAASIKADLHLSDTALGLLFGLSFGLFYTLVGLPIAYFVDRVSRRWILALGLATWNIGTALCGVAQNFAQLFTARFVVGAGEGVNGPTSYAIVGDLFPREKMTRAIALLHLGDVVGPAIALLIGAWLLHVFLGMKPIHVFFGVIHGWQLIFILIGLPSILISVLVLTTVPEPARRTIRGQMAQLERRTAAAGPGLTAWLRDYGVAIRYMRLKRGVFVPMFASLLVGSLSIGGLSWGPIFYQRTYGWGPARLAGLQSLAQLVVVPLGLLVSVVLAERFSRLGRDDSALRVFIISLVIAIPGLFYPLMPSPWLAFGLGTIGYFCSGMAGASENAALQIVTPTELRGKVTALFLFIYYVVGVALSPILNALITDYVLRNESLVRWAIFWPSIVCRPLSLVIAWVGLRPYGREVARLRSLDR
ncbi:MAG: MFS transporter [Steroidobacteraceae bacterium]